MAVVDGRKDKIEGSHYSLACEKSESKTPSPK
jgi:hypothetical protein